LRVTPVTSRLDAAAAGWHNLLEKRRVYHQQTACQGGIDMNILKAAAGLAVLSGTVAAAAVVTPASEQVTIRRAQSGSVLIGGEGRLGISVRDLEDEDTKTARPPGGTGAMIEEVSTESPAEKAGLRKGDVVVEFDGERVRSARQLTRLVLETAEGRQVSVVVVRDGQRVTVTAALRSGGGTFAQSLHDLEDWGRNFRFEVPARPVTPPAPRVRPTPPSVWRMDDLLLRGGSRLGLTVDTLSPQLAEYFGTKQGVLVTSVQDGSAAAKAGIRAGDVITSVNGLEVSDPPELRRRLQALDRGSEVSLGIVRDKKPQTLKGKLEETTRRRSYRSII
jgi:serine protease Do